VILNGGNGFVEMNEAIASLGTTKTASVAAPSKPLMELAIIVIAKKAANLQGIAQSWAKHFVQQNVTLYALAAKDIKLPTPFERLEASGTLSEADLRRLSDNTPLTALELLFHVNATFNWILLVRDTTFVRTEELLKALRPYNPHDTELMLGQPWVAGNWSSPKSSPCLPSAGYVISNKLWMNVHNQLLHCPGQDTKSTNTDVLLHSCLQNNAGPGFIGCQGLTKYERWTRFVSISGDDYLHTNDAIYIIKNRVTMIGASYGNSLTIGNVSPQLMVILNKLYGEAGELRNESGLVGHHIT